MSLFETLVSLLILSLFLSFGGKSFYSSCLLNAENEKIIQGYRRDFFIKKTFENECKNPEKSSWNSRIIKWKNMCLSLWKIDEIEVKEGEKLYSAFWQSEGRCVKFLFPKEKEILKLVRN